jgi:ribosomal protein L23
MKEMIKKQVIVRPIISEKSIDYYSRLKVCSFLVDVKSSKKDILYTFKEMFGIEPESIKTVVFRKATKNRGKFYSDKYNRVYAKKAYIGIGDSTLDIFENIA